MRAAGILLPLLALSGCAQVTQAEPVPAGPATQTGTATAAVPRTFPFDLHTHCGGGFTTFAGRTWQADNPPGNLPPKPDARGNTRITGYVHGTMTLIDERRAEFTIDVDRVARPPDAPVVFRQVDAPAPLCK